MNDQPPPAPRRSWIPIVIGVLVGLMLLGLAAVGGTVYWVSRHIRSQPVTTSTAAETLAEVRARFAGQAPAITLEDGRASVTPEPASSRRPISALHVLAYDPDEGRLVRVDVPGWMLRLMARGNMRVDDVDGLSDVRGRIRFEDLERHGLGLVLDTTTDDGAQVLIWTE